MDGWSASVFNDVTLILPVRPTGLGSDPRRSNRVAFLNTHQRANTVVSSGYFDSKYVRSYICGNSLEDFDSCSQLRSISNHPSPETMIYHWYPLRIERTQKVPSKCLMCCPVFIFTKQVMFLLRFVCLFAFVCCLSINKITKITKLRFSGNFKGVNIRTCFRLNCSYLTVFP